MKTTGIVRNIDQLGRIVVPKEMCRTLGIASGDPVEISLEGKRIILQKREDTCTFCAGSDHTVPFGEKLVCRKCLAQLKDL